VDDVLLDKKKYQTAVATASFLLITLQARFH